MRDDQPAGRPEEQTSVGLPAQGQIDPAGAAAAHLDSGTMVGQPVPAGEGELCPACYQPLEADSRFCQACGAETQQPVQAEAAPANQPRWLPFLLVGWLIIMVVALVFLLTFAIQVG